MKLPFIAIKTAENQKDIYKYLKNKNYLVLKEFNAKTLYLYINIIMEELKC